MTNIIYLMRHGETDWNVDGRLQGQTDVPLNDNGRAQARAAVSFVATLDIEACYASDLARALETAQIVISQHPKRFSPIGLAELRERNFGYMNGRTHEVIEAHKRSNPELYIDLDGKGRLFPKDGEQEDIWINRVIGIFERLKNSHQSAILCVTHGGVIRQCIRHYLPHMDVFQPGNAHVYRLSLHQSNISLEQIFPN
jgi:broad specificity phosphatase PhoE